MVDIVRKKKKWGAKRLMTIGGILALVLLIFSAFYFTRGGNKLNVDLDRITISDIKKDKFQESIPQNGTVMPLLTEYVNATDGGRVEELPTEPVTAPSETPAPAASDPPPAPQPAPPESLILSPAEIPALQRQLYSLRQSESIQQQQQNIANAEAKRLAWVRANPLAQKHYDRLGEFHNEALANGHRDMSDAYLGHMTARLASLTPPAEEPRMPAPKFTPRPAAGPPLEASAFSAPVSRDVPGASGRRPAGKVTLTRAEVEAARISGISIEEYTKNKIEYERQLKEGEYRDNRGNG